jgi:NOL1/NOP2/sun family putative RNA methylase
LRLPEPLIQSLQHVKGFDETGFKAVHESGEQVTSIRKNPAKIFLDQRFTVAVPWSSNGYYLAGRPSFTLDPVFHAGAYYVQEASSMFLEEALKQAIDLSQPIKILDLCAAPGGKSTLIQSLISSDSLLVSNEIIKTRVNVLNENITKWGGDNVIVCNNDPKDFQRLENYFDAVVIDAPCSGSGLFRKDPSAIEEWSIKNVQLCSQRQQRIIADVFSSLKEDGILVYSTCSYSEEENENVCDWIIDQFPVSSLQFAIDNSWGIVETESKKFKAQGYRFYPGKVKGEGFFIAAFRKKTATAFGYQERKEKPVAGKVSKNEIDSISPWLKHPGNHFFIKQNEEIIAMPLHLQHELALLLSSLYIKKAGIRMGTVIRDELIPHHELALSTITNSHVPACEVELGTALQYLRKQDIKIDTAIKGWALIKYLQLPLGWVKILPNRINNYYPASWRILNK